MRANRDAARRYAELHANPLCVRCFGEGIVTFTASNRDGETEVQCPCVEGTDHTPDPLADETGFDARELARDRDR